ncbi:hypothetical protein [Streptomyces mirabilis]
MAAVMVACGSIEVVVGVFGKYLGLDLTESLQQMKEERIAFLHRAIGIAHTE